MLCLAFSNRYCGVSLSKTNIRWNLLPRKALFSGTVYSKLPLLSTDQIFPFIDAFELSGGTVTSRKIIEVLDPMLSTSRKETIQSVISNRTFNVVPVIEGVINSGNIAAVLRSADGLGFGALHCIEHERAFRKMSERCSSGAEKWMHVRNWNSTSECLMSLKTSGYQIIAAHVTSKSVPIQEVNWSVPIAVVLGNEGEGVSKEALSLADYSTMIPMSGFVESFNISVAAALILYEARRSRISQFGKQGDLTPQQKQILQAAFYIRHKVDIQSSSSSSITTRVCFRIRCSILHVKFYDAPNCSFDFNGVLMEYSVTSR